MRKHFSCLKEQNGFTMTEVMVVVAIIGILGTVAVPYYFSMRPTKNMHADGRDLLSEIQMMKLEAVKRNTCVGLVFQPVIQPALGGSYTVFVDDGTGAGNACDAVWYNPPLPLVGELPLRAITVREGVALTASPVAPTTNDPNVRTLAPVLDTDLFSAISFNSRALLQTRLNVGSFVLKNNGNPAQATLWTRVVVRTAGDAGIQTNTKADIQANEANWSR